MHECAHALILHLYATVLHNIIKYLTLMFGGALHLSHFIEYTKKKTVTLRGKENNSKAQHKLFVCITQCIIGLHMQLIHFYLDNTTKRQMESSASSSSLLFYSNDDNGHGSNNNNKTKQMPTKLMQNVYQIIKRSSTSSSSNEVRVCI